MAVGEAPYEVRTASLGLPTLLEVRMRTHKLGPLALWSTICVRGELGWARARMRTVDLAMGHDPCEGCAVVCWNGCGPACELAEWGRRCSSSGCTIRVKGLPKLVCALMRTGPVGSLGGGSLRGTILVMGVHGRGPACEFAQWMEHAPCEGCA